MCPKLQQSNDNIPEKKQKRKNYNYLMFFFLHFKHSPGYKIQFSSCQQDSKNYCINYNSRQRGQNCSKLIMDLLHILNGRFSDLEWSNLAFLNCVFLVAICWKRFAPPNLCLFCLIFFLLPLSYSSSLYKFEQPLGDYNLQTRQCYQEIRKALSFLDLNGTRS